MRALALLAAGLLAPGPGHPGHSAGGRPIPVYERGNAASPNRVLVVGCIHGTECAAIPVVRRLLAAAPLEGADLWLVPDLNPDGLARGTRGNGNGVDLNRNFPSEWRAIAPRGDQQYPGPRPLSEPESRFAASLVERVRPTVSIWFHQPQAIVRAWGGSIATAQRFAVLAAMPFRRIRWPTGTASNWQNHRFPHTASFVVELPPGPLSPLRVARLARAVERLAVEGYRGR
jgi:protein MpaA